MEERKTRVNMLRAVVLAYANTPWGDLDTLRDTIVELAILHPEISEHSKESVIGDLDAYVALIFRLHEIGVEKARAIYNDPSEKDAFLKTCDGIHDGPLWQREHNRRLVDEAFSCLYGYGLATECPCSPTKAALLKDKGFLFYHEGSECPVNEAGEPFRGAMPCMHCDQIHFTAILESIMAGQFDYLGEIVKGYHKTAITEASWGGAKRPIAFSVSYSYADNHHAFPAYLKGLPCNALVELLAGDPGEAKRLRRCYICEEFFFGDPRSLACPEEICQKLFVTARKTWERETGRDKSTINADNEFRKTGAYERLATHWNYSDVDRVSLTCKI